MIPPDKAVRSVLVLMAFGMMAIGALQIGLEYARHKLKGVEVDLLTCALWGGLVALGLALMAVSGKIARKFLDEDDDEWPPSETEEQ